MSDNADLRTKTSLVSAQRGRRVVSRLDILTVIFALLSAGALMIWAHHVDRRSADTGRPVTTITDSKMPSDRP